MLKAVESSAILFDMDGTLVNSEKIYAEALEFVLNELLPAVELPSKDILYQQILGRSHGDVMRSMSISYAIDPSSLSERFDVCYTRMKLAMGERLVIQSSLDLLIKLHEMGFPIAIVSGSTRKHINENLAILGIIRRISVIVASENCTNGKPDSEPYLHAIEQMGKPEYLVVFEDSCAGVESAKAARPNSYVIALGVDKEKHEALLRAGANIVVQALSSDHLPDFMFEKALRLKK